MRADWRIMSLAYLNLEQRVQGLSNDYRALMETAWGSVRVCAVAAEHAGRDVLGPLYTAIGTRLHNQRRREDLTVITEALAETNLPSGRPRRWDARASRRRDGAVRPRTPAGPAARPPERSGTAWPWSPPGRPVRDAGRKRGVTAHADCAQLLQREGVGRLRRRAQRPGSKGAPTGLSGPWPVR
ncbi:hypothetical protein OG689_42110 [Kitasatospora sp. NBC_00240]|uniref:mycothiol-dependent nitroreductase Rv2466c family protein n=1 Tax=Kitasatospora sp. NBC_00240 TaxID=2903567 RepID=UPI002259FE96|nr:hypothetical protein [Kitasatospora sp. NBC_00240]MCX5215752.1 hypothetical protein [Kitasatospora sp. NBC_00240]